MRYGYPVFLDLQDQPCIVFGGNWMAEEKARGLVEAGARLTVISAELDPSFGPLIATSHCQWVARDYQAGDLKGCFLAVSAGDRSYNAAIWAEGQLKTSSSTASTTHRIAVTSTLPFTAKATLLWRSPPPAGVRLWP